MYRNRRDLFYLSKSVEDKYRNKEPWQKPLGVFKATDGKLKAAFESYRQTSGSYGSSDYWASREPDGQKAVSDAENRWKQAVQQALEEGKRLSQDVASDARGNLQGMWADLRQRVVMTDTLKGANWQRGFDSVGVMTRGVLVYQGLAKGILTDGFVLVVSPNAAKEVLGPLIKKQKLSPAALAKKKTEGTFPDFSQLWPDMSQVRPVKLVAQAQVPDEYGYIRAYLTDGERITVVNSDKLALVMRYFPGAKMMQADPGGPIVFVQANGDKVGMVMPLWEDASSHPKEVQKLVQGAEGTKPITDVTSLSQFQAAIERKYGATVVDKEMRKDGFDYWRLSNGQEVKVYAEKARVSKLTRKGVLHPTTHGKDKWSEMGVTEAPPEAAPAPQPKRTLADLVKHYEDDWVNLDIGIVQGETDDEWKARVKREATLRAANDILEGFGSLGEAQDWLTDMKPDAVMYTAAGYEFNPTMLTEAIQAKKQYLSGNLEPWQMTGRDVFQVVGTPGMRYKDAEGHVWEFTGKHDRVGLAWDYEIKDVSTGKLAHTTLREVKANHQESVRAALVKRVPVSERVLKDYPKLEEEARALRAALEVGQLADKAMVSGSIMKERLHKARVYTPIDRLLVSGDVKKPVNGDTLVWQVYDIEGRRWVEKQRAVYGTPEGNTLLDALNDKYQAARAAEDWKPHDAPSVQPAAEANTAAPSGADRKAEAAESYAAALKLEGQRSPTSKARDEAQENVVVVPRSKMTPRKLESWRRRPGRFDIKGVDTPKKKRKPRLSR